MNTPEIPVEIEAKFFPVDKDRIRNKLKELGATLVDPERMMQRVIYNREQNPNIHGTYLRIRNEGEKTRISIKVIAELDGEVSDQKEVDIETPDFDKAKLLIDSIGCIATKYQENYRETWGYRQSEIVIDTWPGLEPYVEIESPNEDELKKIADELEFDWEQKCIGSTDDLYAQKYGMTKEKILELITKCTFEENPFENLDS